MTSHKPFPSNPDLRIFRNQVQSLVNAYESKDDDAPLSTADARNLVAREYGSTTGTPSARRSSPPPPTRCARRRIRPRSRPTTSSSRPSARATSTGSASSSIRTRPSQTRTCGALPPSAATGGWGSPWGDPSEGETVRAVHFAAYGHADLLRLLIEYGADVDAYGYEGNHQWSPPLVLACWEGSRETVQILLEAGANPNLPAIHGGSPLHSAINHWDQWKIDILLRYGARHDIFSASVVGDLEEVKRQMNDGDFLLSRRDMYRNRTALEWAAFRRQEEVGEYLIEQGAEVTPQVLICLGMLDEIKKCVEDDPEFVNRRIGAEWSDPPLLWAIRSGQVEVLKYLLSVGADPNGRGSWDQMALPLTVDLPVETSLEVAKMLIDAGADVEVTRRQTGRTHLGEFTTKGNLEVADLLIRHGAEVNRKNWHGQTPLQALIYPPSWEERYGDPFIGIEFLLSHGADVNALSDDGKTAVDIAIEQENDAVAAHLRERGGLRAQDLP